MVPIEDKLIILENLRDLAVCIGDEPLVVLRRPPDQARQLFYQPLPDKNLSKTGFCLMSQTEPGKEDPLQSFVFQVVPRAETGRSGPTSDRFILNAKNRLIQL